MNTALQFEPYEGMVLKLAPRAGMRGRLHYIARDEKAEWPESLEVTIVHEGDPTALLVKNDAGRERAFPHWTVDVGHRCWIDGAWHDMESARARRYRAERARQCAAD